MAGYPGNFVDSGIKTVPNRLRTASNAPTTKLAYITPEEEGILQALKPGTPHKGPMGIPNYDSVDFDPSTGQYAVTTSQDWAPHDTGSGPAPQAWQDQQQAVQETGLSQEQIAEALAIKEAEAGKPLTSTEAQDFFQDVPPIPTGAAAETTDASSSLWNDYAKGNLGVATAKLLFGWTNTPKAKQFTNLNDLAIIKALLGGASGKSVDKYYKKYKDIIKEGLGLDPDDPWGQEEFEKKLEDAPDLGVEGEESQFRLNPEEFYEKFTESGEAFYATPQTKGELEKLAGIDVNMLNARGEPLSDEFKQQIFNARNELDRQWGDQGGQGGGQGIADLSPVAQLAATTTPEEVAAATVPAEVAAATTTPAATTTAATEPTPFDYSQWPQFTSAYPGYNQYPWPNYVNQGLGQWPNFDYWNQIANAFPGMS